MLGSDLLDKLYKHADKLKSEDASYGLILADIPNSVDITKKQAAIIVHEYLKRVLNEPDETDTSKVKVLKDLYDCRVCVHHIEQVYCKGIMEPLIDTDKSNETGLPVIFGVNELLAEADADIIVTRVHDKGKRLKV